jgi:uncharacterized repeat protein (TIGR03806 family)
MNGAIEDREGPVGIHLKGRSWERLCFKAVTHASRSIFFIASCLISMAAAYGDDAKSSLAGNAQTIPKQAAKDNPAVQDIKSAVLARTIPSTPTKLLQRLRNDTIKLPSIAPKEGYGAEIAFQLRFAEPVAMASPPGETNRLFVLEKPGRITVITNLAAPTLTTFMDLRDRVYFEQECGLVGMAFHPGYATNRFFYLVYTFSVDQTFAGINIQLARFETSRLDPNKASPDSELPLITQYDGDPWHQAGDLHFGPDGYLYISLGDGGQAGPENAQRIDLNFFSGILRIDVDKRPGSLPPNPHAGSSIHYAIPPDNPFIGATKFNGLPVDPQTVRTEFFAVGLRNPWRFSFDPATGDLYSNDTGDTYREEVNLILKGGNYGWPYREGTFTHTNAIPLGRDLSALAPPLAEYGYESGGAGTGKAIAGGISYRGTNLPALSGAYVFSDFWTGDIGLIRLPPSDRASQTKEIQDEIVRTENLLRTMSAQLEANQAEWEKQWLDTDRSWRILDPSEFVSSSGTKLAKLRDHSILASGVVPWDDIYTVTARTVLTNITAVRLELMLDDSLPNYGPGRAASGNIVLSEFEVAAAPLFDSASIEVVPLTNPSADFAQNGWPLEAALDGLSETGWAISPAVGQAHQAVFELETPARFPDGALLRFSLDQSYGSQVVIGRFRISISSSPTPPKADLASSLVEILRLRAQDRTEKQKERLALYYRSIDPGIQRIQEQLVALRQKQLERARIETGPVEWISNQPGMASFAINPSNGDLLMADMLSGVLRRLVPFTNGSSPFPATLAETGIFSDLQTLRPQTGIVPYSVNVPFWSDHSIKKRWFSLPESNQTITFTADGNWQFPPGTVWIKHFDLELTNGLPTSARRLETRVLIRNSEGIHGATYRWDQAGRNAHLVPAEGQNEIIQVYDGVQTNSQVWRYPSRAQCGQCHTAVGGYALGFNTAQLNRKMDDDLSPNQIQALSDAGYFHTRVTNRYLLPALAHAHNSDVSREYRVRSYLHANCVQCHQPGAAGRSLWDARITTPRNLTGLINGLPVHGSKYPDDRLVKPGAAERSVLVQRLSALDASHMPPFGSGLVDVEAVVLLSGWINHDLAAYETFDEWLANHFSAPDSQLASAEADPDNDGANNYLEYLTGTDPLLGSEVWKIRIEKIENQPFITFPRRANLSFEVQWTTDLSNSWRPLLTPSNRPFFSAADGTALIGIPTQPSPASFYRVVIREP